MDLSGRDEDIADINEQLAEMREQLVAVTGGEGTGAGERLDRDELSKLANKVHDSLPLVTDTHELADLKESVVPLPEDERSGTVGDLAEEQFSDYATPSGNTSSKLIERNDGRRGSSYSGGTFSESRLGDEERT